MIVLDFKVPYYGTCVQHKEHKPANTQGIMFILHNYYTYSLYHSYISITFSHATIKAAEYVQCQESYM